MHASRTVHFALATTAFLAAAALARAADGVEAWEPTLSARGGTLGFGPELGVRIPGTAFGLRADFDVFSYSEDDLYSHHFVNDDPIGGYDFDARFDGAVRLLNGGLTADYYPLGSGLRVSAGVIVNGDRITAIAEPSGAARISNRIYDVANAGSVSMKALVDTVSPYVGVGYSARIFGNLVASIDAGILVEGDPRVSLAVNGPPAALPNFLSQVEDERRRIANDIDVPVYPVVEIGIGYRF